MITSSLIDASLMAWFALTALSVPYVAWDSFRNNPEMTVMKWGFILVTVFMGPIGAAIYVLSCKPPVPREHAVFVNPLWKQAVGSTVHCLAGDATGIILAAAITMAMGLVMWHDLIAEYAFGFAFGLLIFQAIFMRDMFGGSYLEAVKKSFFPEWISMNAVMAGMVPVMVVLMSRDMSSMHPASPRFWGVMSLATIVGFATAYPINLWLVGVRLKHGMGTTLALGDGGHAVTAEKGGAAVTSQKHKGHTSPQMPAEMDHSVGDVEPSTTGAQRMAMAGLSLIALWAGVVIAATGGDLGMQSNSSAMRMTGTMTPGAHPSASPSQR